MEKDDRLKPVSSQWDTYVLIFLAYTCQLIKSLLQSLMDWPEQQQSSYQLVLPEWLPQGDAILSGEEEEDTTMMMYDDTVDDYVASFGLWQKSVHLADTN